NDLQGDVSMITNSTFTANMVTAKVTSQGNGGGIWGRNLMLINCTVAGNHAQGPFIGGGGLEVTNANTVTLRNPILAGNSVGGVGSTDPDVEGFVAAESTNNLIGDGAGLNGLVNGTNGNLVGTAANPIDPKLGNLKDNGGPTPTMALLPGSPAIDAGS